MSLSDAQVAIAAALAGADVVARDYGATHARSAKSATDVATQTDVDAEAAVVGVLASHRPQDRLIGEESGNSGPTPNTRRWLIDPLCGTLNFAATTPLLAVNVALIDDAGTGAAASIDPIADEVLALSRSTATARLIARSSVDSSSTTLACALATALESSPPRWAWPGWLRVDGRHTFPTARSTRTCTSPLG